MGREPIDLIDLVEFMSIVIWLSWSYVVGAFKFYEFVTSREAASYNSKEDRIRALLQFIFSPIVIPVLAVVGFIRWVNHG